MDKPKRNLKKASVSRGQITRARLLTVATQIFAEKGFEGAAVDEIVIKADVNKRMVYHYFGSKEELYQACLVETYAKLETLETIVLSPKLSPAKAIEAIMEAYFKFLASESEFVRLLLWENLNRGRMIKKHRHLLSKAPLHKHLEEVVRSGVKQGVFRKNLDVDFLAISMIGLSFIYYSNQYTLSQGLNLDLSSRTTRKKAIAFATALLLQGVKRKS
ncbi:MAG: TetR/AcrR family transcriptional regulator [Chthoniobacterales bacterium]